MPNHRNSRKNDESYFLIPCINTMHLKMKQNKLEDVEMPNQDQALKKEEWDFSYSSIIGSNCITRSAAPSYFPYHKERADSIILLLLLRMSVNAQRYKHEIQYYPANWCRETHWNFLSIFYLVSFNTQYSLFHFTVQVDKSRWIFFISLVNRNFIISQQPLP